jgi:hypothetical protein
MPTMVAYMSMKVKSLSNLRDFNNGKALAFVTVLFMIVLISSCFASMFSSVSPFTSGASNIAVMVDSAISSNTVSGDCPGGSAGGIWIYAKHLNRLFISDAVVFSNNLASASHKRDPIYDMMHYLQITPKVTWSAPFTQSYNNYDTGYIHTTSATYYTVTVHGSYASPSGEGSYLPGEPVIAIPF